MGKKPKEDPQDKKARLRERRLSEIERQQSAEGNAAGLSADIRAVYGALKGNRPSMPFGPAPRPGLTFPFSPLRNATTGGYGTK